MKLAALLAVVVGVLAVPMAARAHLGIKPLFKTGRVSLLASSQSPMFDLKNMAAGSHATRSLNVANNGTLNASWQLGATTRGDATTLHCLRLTVDELRSDGRRRVFAGPLASLNRVDLGVVAPGDSRTYVFTVRWPGVATTRPGTAKVDFSWTATGV